MPIGTVEFFRCWTAVGALLALLEGNDRMEMLRRLMEELVHLVAG